MCCEQVVRSNMPGVMHVPVIPYLGGLHRRTGNSSLPWATWQVLGTSRLHSESLFREAKQKSTSKKEKRKRKKNRAHSTYICHLLRVHLFALPYHVTVSTLPFPHFHFLWFSMCLPVCYFLLFNFLAHNDEDTYLFKILLFNILLSVPFICH